MPDGAPSFSILGPDGHVVRRVECINNHFFDPDELAGRFIGSADVLARVIAREGAIGVNDLGPALFNCVVATAGR